MKVVINVCFGGFSVSDAVMEKLGFPITEERVGHNWNYLDNSDFGLESPEYKAFRSDPRLVAAVEELGTAADGALAELRVVELPDGVEWTIEEYDGTEWVAEKHRTWR